MIPETETDADGNPQTVTINGQSMIAPNSDGSILKRRDEKAKPRVYNKEANSRHYLKLKELRQLKR